MSADLIIVKKVHDGYIVHIKGREEHAHFAHRSGAMMFKKLIANGKLPSKHYFLVAAQRILTIKELSDLKSTHKQTYVNRGYSHV